MGVYKLELEMYPVQLTSCTLTLVKDIDPLQQAICATLVAHTQKYEDA